MEPEGTPSKLVRDIRVNSYVDDKLWRLELVLVLAMDVACLSRLGESGTSMSSGLATLLSTLGSVGLGLALCMKR